VTGEYSHGNSEGRKEAVLGILAAGDYETLGVGGGSVIEGERAGVVEGGRQRVW
jgi:hypothetical protein